VTSTVGSMGKEGMVAEGGRWRNGCKNCIWLGTVDAVDAAGVAQEVDVYTCQGEFLMFKWNDYDTTGLYLSQVAPLDTHDPELPWWLVKVAVAVLFKRDAPIDGRRHCDPNTTLLDTDGRW
jgi:hypothetical protein